MTDIPKQYRSTSPEQAVAHLAEELAECATACAKALRWGLDSCNPELPLSERETNLAWIRREMRDVVRAYRALDSQLAEHGYLIKGELSQDLAQEAA